MSTVKQNKANLLLNVLKNRINKMPDNYYLYYDDKELLIKISDKLKFKGRKGYMFEYASCFKRHFESLENLDVIGDLLVHDFVFNKNNTNKVSLELAATFRD